MLFVEGLSICCGEGGLDGRDRVPSILRCLCAAGEKPTAAAASAPRPGRGWSGEQGGEPASSQGSCNSLSSLTFAPGADGGLSSGPSPLAPRAGGGESLSERRGVETLSLHDVRGFALPERGSAQGSAPMSSGRAMRATLEQILAYLQAQVLAFHEEQLLRGCALLADCRAAVEIAKTSEQRAERSDRSGRAPPPPLPPLYSLAVTLPHVQLLFTPSQLCCVAAAASYLGAPEGYELWRRFRPGWRPTEAPRLWWQQVVHAIIDEVKRCRPRFDWGLLKSRRVERKRYVTLFTRKLRFARLGGRQPGADKKALLELERGLPVEMILFYRQVSLPPAACRLLPAASPFRDSDVIRDDARLPPSARRTGAARPLPPPPLPPSRPVVLIPSC